MAIYFTSSSAFSGSSLYPAGFLTYLARVKADGGVIGDIDALFETYREIERLGIDLTDIKALVGPAFGYQVNGSGFITKMYNLSNANDFTISGSRAGTGAQLSVANGYPELVFDDVAGSGQRALQSSFSSSGFTFDKIYTAIQIRLDDRTAAPSRNTTLMSYTGNSATSPRNPEPIVILSSVTYEQFSNGLATAETGHYVDRCFFGASAFAKVPPSTSSQRRITNNRISLDDRLTATGAFDAGAGFNGSLIAYSGVSTTYDQDNGYGLGAAMVLTDITDAQWFTLRDKILAVTAG